MKNQNGITLIALVITIIVLLILAGVAIAMLSGENGLLKQADNAKRDTQAGEAVERINLALNAIKLEGVSKLASDNNWKAVTAEEGKDPVLDTDIASSLSTDGFGTTEVTTGYFYTVAADTITLTYTNAQFNLNISGSMAVDGNLITAAVVPTTK